MRIVYVSGSTIPSSSANSIQVMRMCEAFAQQGHDVLLIAQAAEDDRDPYDMYGVRPVFDLVRLTLAGSSRIRQWRYGWQASTVVEEQRPDVVYGRHLPGLALSSFLNVPTLYEVHQPASRFGKIVENWLFRRQTFSRLVTISDALRCEYVNSFPVLARKQVVVSHTAGSIPELASSARSHSGRLQVGYTGHLYPGKGIEMIAELGARLPLFDFHVLGGPPDAVAHWRERLRQFPNVKLYGHVPPSQVLEWQQEMDVLILPCQTDVTSAGGANISAWMSPLKLFEYLACGKAVVASDLPVLREVLDDGVNALLLPPGDIDGWTQTLHRLANPDLRATLGRRARELVRSEHTWSHRAQHVLRGLPQAA